MFARKSQTFYAFLVFYTSAKLRQTPAIQALQGFFSGNFGGAGGSACAPAIVSQNKRFQQLLL